MSDDFFDALLGGYRSRPKGGTPAPASKPEKGIPWEAKVIDGAYYVPLRQVAELLASNGVLPAVRKGIERRVTSLGEGS